MPAANAITEETRSLTVKLSEHDVLYDTILAIAMLSRANRLKWCALRSAVCRRGLKLGAFCASWRAGEKRRRTSEPFWFAAQV